ncbi:MurR/RpiR family transcriptional regulator [Aestuariirhabdus sp. Z084]|uniref:MurR/RpiR family transcriptional regulator n=1 Tax=Aestuariirhabdus haliotis TaxID=2918751 RepID=UPI00201B38E7|nr:MurR/RpiR family transcriptional regulator [Aestuariirhabdus haliotis]MCL6415451.1 MurR/RpiR family transcriptional regulator [Aestuariirhabdus haliotis]MCL6419207.1 MurR/RpiR family transcriptional regulator [Aestuariirhabdus haliotis]
MSKASFTVAERIRNQFENLTRTERQLANAMLENYPVSCLGSITAVAATAEVSTPTVVRMVKKLGFGGFPDFQLSLHTELEETISNPITKFNRWSDSAPDEHILNRFADVTMNNLHQSLKQVDPATFDAVTGLLSDTDHALHVVGGRITHSLADYFFTHMQVMRKRVTRVTSNSGNWPHYLLNMEQGDLLIAFDIRRYEHNINHFAKMAQARGVRVVLFTDQWGSPAAQYAEHVFNLRIEAPSAWDSSVVILFFVEALIASVQSKIWDESKERMGELEGLFDETRLFKKFNQGSS